MREIKFRGKTHDNYKWIVGYYSKKIVAGKELFFIDPIEPENYSTYQVIPETVGQYTGLKDKNGNPIFEGDILEFIVRGKTYHTAPVSYEKGLNIWGNGVALYNFIPEDLPLTELENVDCYKIIGNIHENPELLESEVADE